MRMPRGEYSRGGAKSDWRGGVGRSFPPAAAFASQLKKLRARVRKDADRVRSASFLTLARSFFNCDAKAAAGGKLRPTPPLQSDLAPPRLYSPRGIRIRG